MTIEDLAVCDIVKVHKRDFVVTAIDALRKYVSGCFVEFLESKRTIEIPFTDVKPSPITREGLKRRGFQKADGGNWYVKGFVVVMPQSGGLYRVFAPDCVVAELAYIHELQHFMRMFNKEEK